MSVRKLITSQTTGCFGGVSLDFRTAYHPQTQQAVMDGQPVIALVCSTGKTGWEKWLRDENWTHFPVKKKKVLSVPLSSIPYRVGEKMWEGVREVFGCKKRNLGVL